MEYPKKLMSVTELSKMGYSVTFLRQLAHAKHAPIIRGNAINSKIYFITDKLDEFIERQRKTR